MPMASTPLTAIGSHSWDQTGNVASSHSDFDHAWIFRMPDGKVVTSSSHKSASRSGHSASTGLTTTTMGDIVMANPIRRDLYADVTARILAKLEQGVVPWAKPWNASTAMPGWMGERLNVAWAIDVLHPLAAGGSVVS